MTLFTYRTLHLSQLLVSSKYMLAHLQLVRKEAETQQKLSYFKVKSREILTKTKKHCAF